MRPAPSQQPDDLPVITTNDEAFQSKVSAMDRGYFSDPFLAAMRDSHQLFASRSSPYRRQPVMNRGTYARVLIKSSLINSFLSLVNSPEAQVLSLGAGFDTFPFNLLSSAYTSSHGAPVPHPRRYLEADLLPVVEDKLKLANAFLKPGQLFSSTKRENGSFFAETHSRNSPTGATHYSLSACDLRDVSSLRKCLEEAGFDPAAPTIILAEIVLVYLDPSLSDQVITFLNGWFTGLRAFINIEHTGSGDAFGNQMDSNIASRGSPLLGMRKYPTMKAQRDRFLSLGWGHISTSSMLQCFGQLKSREEAILLQKVEILDEVEEWNMLMEHYCVVVALSGHLSEADLQWLNKPFR